MIAHIGDLAAHSPSPSVFEADLLEWLAEDIGFEVGFLSSRGAETSPTVLGLDSTLCERAVARGPIYYQELLPVKRAALAARGVAVDTEVLGEPAVRRTHYFRELAAHVGGKHSLFAYIPWRGSIVGALMLGRTGSAFSPSDKYRVEKLLPGLGVARAAFGFTCDFPPLYPAGGRRLLERLLPGTRPRVLAWRAIPGGMLEVRDHDGYREMVACAGNSEVVWTRARLDDPSRSGWPYVELFHVAAALAKQRKRALFIGCGGAVALRQFAQSYQGIEIDLVESEPAVIDLARAWFDLDSIPNLTVRIADGAQFVQRAPAGLWDIAVIDAFDSSGLSTALTTRSFFAALRRSLRPEGAMALNLIDKLDGNGPLRSVSGAMADEFDQIRIVPVVAHEEHLSVGTLRNIVVIASPRR